MEATEQKMTIDAKGDFDIKTFTTCQPVQGPCTFVKTGQ
jgi:hypothetical protein